VVADRSVNGEVRKRRRHAILLIGKIYQAHGKGVDDGLADVFSRMES
jgi:hypothetical protein